MLDAQSHRNVSQNIMTKMHRLMMFALVALAGVYVFYFTDWFKPKTIHISHTSRIVRPRLAGNLRANQGLPPITFGVEPQSRLTEITVVPLAACQTNQNTLPLWHLVASTNA